jgi:hypothetical protein
MGHATSAKATDMAAAKTSHVITANTYVASAKTTHVTATAETTHVTTTTTKTTHMAAAKAAAHVAATTTAPATASAGLSTRGKQAAGEHRACQNHHHSSSHDLLHWDGRTFRHKAWSGVGIKAKATMNWKWDCVFVVSTKFAFIQIGCRLGSPAIFL